jgi:hypothetical protein
MNPEGTQGRSSLGRWALEQFHLPADASPAAARSALMQRLREEEFVPPLTWQQAHRTLTQPDGAAPPEYYVYAEEERLRTEIELLASNFFTLDVEKRQQQWQGLMEQSKKFPQPAARLRALESGLKLIPGPVTGGRFCQLLADQLHELFVLRPAERAVRRQELFAKVRPWLDDIQKAARQLKRAHPEVAALDPVWIEQLAYWQRDKGLEWADLVPAFLYSKHPRRHRGRNRKEAVLRLPAGSGNTGSSWLPVIVIIGIVMGVLGKASTNQSPRYSPPPYIPPTWSVPDRFERFRDLDKEFKRSQEQEEAIRRLMEPHPVKDSEYEKRVREFLEKDPRNKYKLPPFLLPPPGQNPPAPKPGPQLPPSPR